MRLFVGCRYDKYKVAPAFPFGHGLSYGSFKYSDLKVEGRTISMTVQRIADHTHQHRQQLSVASNSRSDSSSESLPGGSCDTPQICESQLRISPALLVLLARCLPPQLGFLQTHCSITTVLSITVPPPPALCQSDHRFQLSWCIG